MKNLFIVVALFFSFHLSYSQGNLQFNTTVYKTFGPVIITQSFDESIEMGSFTISENKVYKVSISGYYNAPSWSYPRTLYVFIEKNEDSVKSYISSGSMSSVGTVLLGAGTYKLYAQTSSNPGIDASGFIVMSGTEFNIISE